MQFLYFFKVSQEPDRQTALGIIQTDTHGISIRQTDARRETDRQTRCGTSHETGGETNIYRHPVTHVYRLVDNHD